MKRKPRRREATPVAHMILSKRMADHKPHDTVCELVGLSPGEFPGLRAGGVI